MAFIDTIPVADATDEVRDMYEQAQSEWGYVPDYAKVFCRRPKVMARWGALLDEIKRPLDPRRLEMATFAAAHELRHSACSLAHGSQLASIIGMDAVIAIANEQPCDEITDAEWAMIAFSRHVARDASGITANEVAALRDAHGFTDDEIFDIVAVAAGRSFFTKVLDALGSVPDLPFMEVDEKLREALVVGRSIGSTRPEVLHSEPD